MDSSGYNLKAMKKAQKAMLKNVMKGQRPYSMPDAVENKLLQWWGEGKYNQISEGVDDWGKALKGTLSRAPAEKVVGLALQSKAAMNFSQRADEAKARFYKQLSFDPRTAGGQITGLYAPQIEDAFRRTADSAVNVARTKFAVTFIT